MLAYVLWHRRLRDVDAAVYEQRLRAFHATLGETVVNSAAFRLPRLPFSALEGYEDWYVVAGWAALGALNDAALAGARRAPHDAAAAATEEGWGGVYRLVRGEPVPPVAARWRAKPRGEPYDAWLAARRETVVWQRQMTLGPGPEFCLAGGPAAEVRERVA